MAWDADWTSIKLLRSSPLPTRIVHHHVGYQARWRHQHRLAGSGPRARRRHIKDGVPYRGLYNVIRLFISLPCFGCGYTDICPAFFIYAHSSLGPHFTNYLKYIFYFILGQFVLCTTFQLTGTVRATFQLTYISAYWDSPNLCFQGAKSTPKRGFKSTPKWGP